ncbi:MAG TPA: hypothetical protein VNK04_26465 [Gemmataceae bacterium]|nr:hypothetical protein [Gemmataceae bacterium]
MMTNYEVRWISKPRADALKRSGRLGDALLLDTFNGILIVEPAGSNLGDGAVLTREEADYELQPAWFLGPKARLIEARRRLGLDASSPSAASA